MKSPAFEENVLGVVRKQLGRSIDVPARGPSDRRAIWNYDALERRLVLELSATTISKNFQTQMAASPSYLFCLGYWLDMDCLLRVTGPIPTDGLRRLHWNRAAFVIQQLERASSGRFRAEIPSGWTWPAVPLLNHERGRRSPKMRSGLTPERTLEISICQKHEAQKDFSAHVDEIGSFEHQLPLGLFDGVISRKSAWTPGGGSQVDLWAAAVDGMTVHLFELKANGNQPLGMLPQALYYGRLLHHLRVGLDDRRQIGGNCVHLDAIRQAKQIQFWLAGPKVHPLLLSGQRSPLARFNEAYRYEGLAFNILPLELTSQHHWARWSWEGRWPAAEPRSSTIAQTIPVDDPRPD
jgi:hypothetical protein